MDKTEAESLEHEAAIATRIDKRHAEICRQLATHARERFVLVRELRHQMGLMHPRVRSVLGADLKPGMVFWETRSRGTFGPSDMPYVIVEVVNEDEPQPGCDHRLLRISHVSMDPAATGHVGVSTRVGPPEGIGSLGAKTFHIDDFSLEATLDASTQTRPRKNRTMTDEKKKTESAVATALAAGAVRQKDVTLPDARRPSLLGGSFANMMTQMVVTNLMVKLRGWQKDGKGLSAVLEEIAKEHIEMVMEASMQHRPEDVRHLLKQLPTDEARLEYLQALDVCHRCGATPRSSACRGRDG